MAKEKWNEPPLYMPSLSVFVIDDECRTFVWFDGESEVQKIIRIWKGHFHGIWKREFCYVWSCQEGPGAEAGRFGGVGGKTDPFEREFGPR